MLGTNSEVARLLAQISAEYESAQQGMAGISCGSSRHEFITRRMENMSHIHAQLHDLVGDVAIVMIAKQLDSAPDPERQSDL